MPRSTPTVARLQVPRPTPAATKLQVPRARHHTHHRPGHTFSNTNPSWLALVWLIGALWLIWGPTVHQINRTTRIHRAMPAAYIPLVPQASPALGGSGLLGGFGALLGTGSTR